MDTPRFNHLLNSIADAGMELLRARMRTTKGRSKSLPDLCHELLSTKGEASGMAIARDIVDRYRNSDEPTRLKFFQTVHNEFGVNTDAVLQAAKDYCKSQDPITLRQLTQQIESNRQELFRRINIAPGGVGTIVEMRHDLLRLMGPHPHLEAVDYDLKHLLASWFNRGFLELQQIDWESPATVLEKLIQYESVHEIKGWGDLRGRLANDRRCFAFFHPNLRNEPLIFVEVALVKGLSQSIQPVIDADRSITNPQQADTAIFYSINNCQQGLRGVSFGNLLIKQVVQQLSLEFPQLKFFSTLSPIPGFRKWLMSIIDEADNYGVATDDQVLLQQTQADNWYENEVLMESLKPVLIMLCAYYLTRIRRGDEPQDPVARFHLSNGARLERINWLGDSSVNGFEQSLGMLANYVYDPEKIVQNHESYVKDKHFATAKGITELVPQELRTNKPRNTRKRVKHSA